MVELNKIYNEDCLETMKKMEDGSIDIIITSPPYNMNIMLQNRQYKKRKMNDGTSNTKYSTYTDDMDIEDYYIFQKKCYYRNVKSFKNSLL